MSGYKISLNDINNFIDSEREDQVPHFSTVVIVDFSSISNETFLAMLNIEKLVGKLPEHQSNLNSYSYFSLAVERGEIDLCKLSNRQKLLFLTFINNEETQNRIIQLLKKRKSTCLIYKIIFHLF